MSIEFSVDCEPSKELVSAVEACAPWNPFYTWAFIEARRALGYRPCVLSLREHGQLVSGCTAFVRRGRLNRSLEVVSLPDLPSDSPFWDGLVQFCRQERLARLELNSFASKRAAIPALPGEVQRTARTEYVLKLRGADLWDSLSSNHRRNVKRGGKAGLTVRQATDQQACREHVRLIGLSMQRRTERGEKVREPGQMRTFLAFVQNGAGELFQAVLEGKVLSSVLVFFGGRGAYYQSAGTSPEGMELGASHFLIHQIASALQEQSQDVFNLGGAERWNPGLNRFKAGFGAEGVALESAEFFLGSKLRRRLTQAAILLRNDPRRLLQALFWKTERFVVYAADPREIAPPEPMDGVTIEKISDQALLEMAHSDDVEMRAQGERFKRDGFNDAHGIFSNEELAHIVWLITAEHDRTLAVRNVKLNPGEAELTHGLTLPRFRGKGILPFAMRRLCQHAADMGIRRLFAITNVGNVPAQRGCEKAGFALVGKITRFLFPYLLRGGGFTYRGHRKGLERIGRSR